MTTTRELIAERLWDASQAARIAYATEYGFDIKAELWSPKLAGFRAQYLAMADEVIRMTGGAMKAFVDSEDHADVRLWRKPPCPHCTPQAVEKSWQKMKGNL